MDFIITLFWIGLWISVALFVVQIVLTIGVGIMAVIFGGIATLWEKLTEKK